MNLGGNMNEKKLKNVKLILATVEDAMEIHRIKYEAFIPLYEKYGDDETSPVKEPLEKTIALLKQDFSDYYLIQFKGQNVGAVRLVKQQDKIIRISPLFILPEYQNKGIGRECISNLFEKYGEVFCWKLESILQEKGNCHLYEKMGFQRTGGEKVINSKMTLINYEKKNVTPYSDERNEYLAVDDVIDYKNEAIVQLADTLFQKANSELEFIKAAYEFVRDNISHSADINEDKITCSASEVLKEGHGICFAKSHLLAALLRCKSIPAGFCYQKVNIADETVPVLVYHGLNGVYMKEYKKWIRLDARGNKNGVNAQFSIEDEHLAFPIRPEMGEEDGFVVYPEPDIKILEKLRENRTRTELWDNLPTELARGYEL